MESATQILIDKSDRNNRSASLDRDDIQREPDHSRASNPIAPIVSIAPTLLNKPRAKHTSPFTFHLSPLTFHFIAFTFLLKKSSPRSRNHEETKCETYYIFR